MRLTLVYIISFVLLLALSYAEAQEVDKKAYKKSFLEADYFFLRGDFAESAFLYEELLKENPSNANLNFLTGASYLSLPGQKSKSVKFLELAVDNISPGYREGSYKETSAPKEALFALARAYHINNDFEKAIQYYDKYKRVMRISDVAEIEYVNKQIQSVELAKIMMNDTLKVQHFDLSNALNIAATGFNSVFAEGDSTIVYMVNRPFYSAIMMTRKEKGVWLIPRNINAELKADGDCQVTDISYDGKELYLSKNENFNSDIYVSVFEKGHWKEMEPLSDNINTIFNETHASISKNKKTIYFTSDRPDGMGAMDIYVSQRNKDGSWGEAQNLGKPINSIYSEETPFITEDGQRLFFSSMSHATMGGFDVFSSKKLPSNGWSYPANVGYPVSTADDDLFYFPLDNGEQALYSVKDRIFDGNALMLLSYKEKDPDWKVTFKGKLTTDNNLELPAETKVNIIDSKSRELVASLSPDTLTGEFEIEIERGSYDVEIHSKGYAPVNEIIDMATTIGAGSINMETNLKPDDVENGKYVVSKNVLFGFDSYELSEEAKFEMEKLYLVMADNPEVYIEVTGHTDSKGSAEYNLRLSNNRSRAVVEYLVSKGISRERFVTKAVGEDDNLAINQNPDGSDNPDGRKLNRQVEINLLNTAVGKKIWVEQYMVPEELKPASQKNYYVVLDERKDNLESPVDFKDVKLYETGRKHIYAAGIFRNKPDAIDYLNKVIDEDFPQSRIVTEEEFNYLLKPSVPDLNEFHPPFSIQLLALKNEYNLENFKNIENVNQIRSSDGFYRYIYGVYDKYEDAQEDLVNFVLKGYTDAYIIEISRFGKSDSLIWDVDETYSFYYTIQFSATKKQADQNRFENLGNIVMTKGADGFYRYSTGIYLNKLEADKDLKIFRDMGFSDAFIKKISKD
jgi:outer membrane protein OmpA-like peptidoglycan-associated protein